MAKIGTAQVEIKAVVNEQSIADLKEALDGALDGAVAITSTALLAAAVRLHDSLWRNATALEALPDDIFMAWGDLQRALVRLGLTV